MLNLCLRGAAVSHCGVVAKDFLHVFRPHTALSIEHKMRMYQLVENVRNDVVAEITDKMQNCWINTIGYRVTPVPTQFVVCGSVRSFTINVQGGSRGPEPNI
jgi:hypothetical protein